MDLRRDPPAPPASSSQVATATWNGQVPACSVCGRRDATLRVVSYPFVVSLLVVTFQRAITGLWCRRHRLPWSIIAGLISATVGWIGIPFGFVFTPLALLRVARGGERPAAPNAHLLNTVAEHKLQQGDHREAIRCLEASLRFRDDPAVRQRLRGLYPAHGKLAPAHFPQQALTVAAALLGALATGLAAGYLDHLIAVRLGALLQGEVPIYLIILSWAPEVSLAFIGAVFLRPLVEWALVRGRCRQWALAVGVGLSAAALMLYGFLDGRALYDYVDILQVGIAPLTLGEIIPTTAVVLLRGGVLTILEMLAAQGLPAVIDALIVVAAAACYVAVGLSAALGAAGWQARLAEVRAEAGLLETGAALGGWASLGSGLVGLALLFSLFPQQGVVDYIEASYRLYDAYASMQEGDIDAGVAGLQEAIRLRPGWAVGHFLLGSLYQAQGKPEQAVAELQEVIRREPRLAVAHSQLGRVYASQHKFDEALQAHERALGLEESADTYEALASTQLDMDQIAEAMATCQQALALDPQSSSAHTTLGVAYMAQGGLDQAVEEFREAVSLDLESFEAQLALGAVYLGQGEFMRALAQLRAAAEAQPAQGLSHALLARVYYELDQPDKVEQEIEAVRAQPMDPITHSALGGTYILLLRFAEAEDEIKQALDLQPGDDELCLALAGVYDRQGKYEPALEMCDRALALHQDSVDAYIMRASIYIDQQRLDEARDELLRILEGRPEHPDAHSLLSVVYLFAGQPEEALAEAEETLRLSPYDLGAWAAKARAHLAQGQTGPAMEAAQRTVELSRKYDVPHYVLGMCYLDQGDGEQAAAELETFLELYWERPYVSDYKAKAEAALAQLGEGVSAE